MVQNLEIVIDLGPLGPGLTISEGRNFLAIGQPSPNNSRDTVLTQTFVLKVVNSALFARRARNYNHLIGPVHDIADWRNCRLPIFRFCLSVARPFPYEKRSTFANTQLAIGNRQCHGWQLAIGSGVSIASIADDL